MTINAQIQQLQDDVLAIRLNKNNSKVAEFKQALLVSLKQKAKLSNTELSTLSFDSYLEVVKKRFRDARNAAIMIVSKSDDSSIGSKLVPQLNVANDDEVNNKLATKLNITYDDLTLEQILSLNVTNTNLVSLVKELEYLNNLLPKQLTESQMLVIINDNKLTNIGQIMKYFKVTYGNQFDNGLLSRVAKNI